MTVEKTQLLNTHVREIEAKADGWQGLLTSPEDPQKVENKVTLIRLKRLLNGVIYYFENSE